MIITNSETQLGSDVQYMGQRLNALLGMSREFDMLVGFFYFSGVKAIADSLAANKSVKMRVLVGLDMERGFGRLVETVRTREGASMDTIRESFFDSLVAVVGDRAMDKKAFHDRLDLFVRLLEEGRLEIRKTLNPNHSKLYLFRLDAEHEKLKKSVWLTGSSNFSEPGLRLQEEFNVEISDFGCTDVQAFYEKLWAEAVPITEDAAAKARLLEILKNQSVAAAITPYEAYLLVLRHYLEFQQTKIDELRLARILAKAGFTKYAYQVDAVAQAKKKLEEFGGVIIADVVGLGKSVVAGLLAAVNGGRGLVICPPGLMGEPTGKAGGWYEYLNKFQLTSRGWEVWSRGDLENLQDRMMGPDGDFDMVVVDEAHNFRNEKSINYELLANICAGKKIVLLTATPFNNRPGDLLALLHLFSSGRNSPFVIGGDLDAVFKDFTLRYRVSTKLNKAVARGERDEIEAALTLCGIPSAAFQEGDFQENVRHAARRFSKKLARDIRRVVENIVIRRNRIDLKDDPVYSQEVTTLSEVQPPAAQFFELTDEQNAFYDRVINDYFGEEGTFKGAAYYPQQYLLDDENQDEYQRNLYTFMRRMLVMRFESSFGAFRQSLVNAERSLKRVREFTDKFHYYLYSRREMDALMDATANDMFQDANSKLIETIERMEAEAAKSGKRGGRNGELWYNLRDKKFDGKKFLKDLDSDIALFGKIIKEVDELKLTDEDPKCAALVKAIGKVLAGKHPVVAPEGTKRKVIVFTSYTDTQTYITKIVAKKFGVLKVLGVSGESFGKEVARTVRNNFDASSAVQDNDFDILITTDKLSEGFNLNRAGLVINYDIPWNPTRVIQRVGRINRIGKKVFDKLYIFNFFPTKKGSAINQNVEIAQTKMFAIHEILGEDAQIFSVDEEPSPSKLFQKLTSGPAEEMSFYTAARIKYAKALAALRKDHPEIEKRLEKLPQMVKTAFESVKDGDTDVKGAFMFRHQGANFFAVGYNREKNEIRQRALEDAIEQIECDFATKRIPFTALFWNGGKDAKGKALPGLYDRLRDYTPAPEAPKQQHGAAGLTNDQLAVQNLDKLIPTLEEGPIKAFAKVVREDVQNYRLLAQATVAKLAIPSFSPSNAEQVSSMLAVLDIQYRIRGLHYLDAEKSRSVADSIIVTVEKQ